ncbi:hybrid sensor histidine kinase/response regulator [Anaerovibrio sp.]|uniref:hybrid sensor histidine kinase/response regulator n=1 Tax=Anaerovibrio sp. TaxID=1872532 RepID=UPI003F15A6DA
MGDLDNLEAFTELDRGSVEKQRKLIRALAMPYETVYGVSMDTGLCTCYRMSESMNEFYDNTDIESDYEDNIRIYVGKDVLDEDKCLFDDICSIRQVKRIFFRKQIHYVNYRVLRNGRIRYLQCLLAKPDNEENEFVLAFKDINEEKKLEIAQQQRIEEAVEEARQANRAKTVFLSNMSHDIRTPMNGIIGMTAIAASHVDDRERVLDSLRKISMASKHLLNLINEVLDMSKIESGKVELKEEPFNLAELVDSLVSMMNPQIEAHQHRLELHVAELEHKYVMGDSLRLQQVFTNLMGNSVKYTPDGGVLSLCVSEKECDREDTGRYEFVFEDNGMGMSEEYVKRIFEPFSRAEDDRVDKIQGTGLGMSITHSLVQMMDGDIQVESELGKGSRFTVTVQLKLQEESAVEDGGGDFGTAESGDTLEAIENLDFSGRRALLAEDNDLNREIAVEILETAGLTVEEAVDGKEAVQQVSQHEDGYYDIIFMDVRMPRMNGYDATCAIRSLELPYCSTVPIVAMTADAFAEDIRAAMEAGMSEHIAKPLNFKVLGRVMRKWLK